MHLLKPRTNGNTIISSDRISTSGILLDHQAPGVRLDQIRAAIEGVDDNKITDLHIWSIGPCIYSATLAVVSDAPKPPEYYKNLIPKDLGIVHTIVEVHHCQH